MRTQRNLVTGIADAALALTGCGAAVSNSGRAPGVHVARVAARNASMGTSAIALEDLAGGQAAHDVGGRVFRTAAAGEPARVPGPA
jgi:hypothetical protein